MTNVVAETSRVKLSLVFLLESVGKLKNLQHIQDTNVLFSVQEIIAAKQILEVHAAT